MTRLRSTRSVSLSSLSSLLCFAVVSFQSVLAKSCVKLLCEDPVFSEYIKCILMDERTFLNNNAAYAFLTCFLHKVRRCVGFLFAEI